uniref:Uncharacterized protein n=1 Tax=Anguilla anguilla TaxID=7936 RepID=A0A0E9XPM2_ANGAN
MCIKHTGIHWCVSHLFLKIFHFQKNMF